MMPRPAPQEDAGEGYTSPASDGRHSVRTTADGFAAVPKASRADAKAAFNHGRHRWLGQLARDNKLPGAAVRVAVLLWELMHSERQYAWPSLVHVAEQLRMNKSTVVRSINALIRRGWIRKSRRGGRHRSNEYRMSWGTMDDETT
jgi:DNA-binding MarR family transcriptional regulator